jgi:hypothetical protein
MPPRNQSGGAVALTPGRRLALANLLEAPSVALELGQAPSAFTGTAKTGASPGENVRSSSVHLPWRSRFVAFRLPVRPCATKQKIRSGCFYV